jgi:DNA invertase Pin-like site-specific DNA recombinase
MRLVAYVRVSRVGGREGDRFISPDVQREQVEALAKARGWDVVEVIQDLDESGGKWERPGFQRALAMVDGGEADGVAVAKLDRFARSVVDGLRGIERIHAAGGEFVSVAEGFDTTTPIGRAMLQISLVFAELERERQAAGFRVSTTRAVESGIHFSATVPVGYRRGADRRLVVDEREAAAVREVFLRRAAGESWKALARFLDETLPRPNGGAWVTSTVAKFVRNRAYLGEAHQGTIVKKGAHAAIVTRAEFEAAQQRPGESRTRSGSMLAGILSCGSCGCPLGRVSTANYGCRARRAGGVCPTPVSIRIARADAEVERVFLEWAARQNVAFEGRRRTADADAALTAVEAAEAELVAYRDGELISIIGRDVYAAGLRERADVLDAARDALAKAQAANTGAAAGIYDVARIWPDLSAAERRTLISSVIERVVVEPSRSTSRVLPVAERLRFVWR